MRLAHWLGLAVLSALAHPGCSHGSSRSTSTVHGTAALATFPTSPTAVVARDETGKLTRAGLAPDGTFTLTLPKGHRYTLAFEANHANVPLAFARVSARLETAFEVKSGAANLDLGAVRYMAAGTSIAGAGVEAKTSCDEGEWGGGGDCENGSDRKTGGPCIDGESVAELADGSQPLALPEKNAPRSIEGCEEEDDDGETNDD